MSEKTKEQILKSCPVSYEYDGHGGSEAFLSKEFVLKAMQAYADQEKRSTAIAFAEWVCGKFHDCGDGTFIILTGGGPLTLGELYDLHINSLDKTV